MIELPDRSALSDFAWREQVDAALLELWAGAEDDTQRASRTSNLLETITSGKVQSLGQVAAGDVILVQMPKGMRAAQAGGIVASSIKRVCPGAKCIGLDSDFEVTKLRALERALWIKELGGEPIALSREDVMPECICPPGDEHKHTCPLVPKREWDVLEVMVFAKPSCKTCHGQGYHYVRREGQPKLMRACMCAQREHKAAVAAVRARRNGEAAPSVLHLPYSKD